MDGYTSIERYALVESFNADKSKFPDSGVFQFPLEVPSKKCFQIDVVQASVPNIMYNVTTKNNRVMLLHKDTNYEPTVEFLVNTRLSPGHYDAYTFIEELTRLINKHVNKQYTDTGLVESGVYRDSSGNIHYAVSVDVNGNITTDKGLFLLASQISQVTNFGAYELQFLTVKGRMRIYYSLDGVEFTLVLATPTTPQDIAKYTEFGITPEMLSQTCHLLMGFDNTRNYSNAGTTEPGYDPSVIGLTYDDIDTDDTANTEMIMSTRYMQIFQDPYISMHILEAVMDPEDIPSYWTDPSGIKSPGYDFNTIHTTDPESPNYGKILFPPIAKIAINASPGSMLYYNYSEYPAFLDIRKLSFFKYKVLMQGVYERKWCYPTYSEYLQVTGGLTVASQTTRYIDKVTVVLTRKSGEILDLNRVDVFSVFRFTELRLPQDDPV